MTFTYKLVRDASGWVAECQESEAQGEGKTQKAAVASLHESLTERMFRPDAVAPPEETEISKITLILAHSETSSEVDYGGPGEPVH